MPDTRPGIVFDEEGVCSPCRHYEQRQNVDWDARWKELEKLANKYRGINGDCYDCIIPVSGGKDSYFAVYTLKERLGMNPLLVAVDNFSWTETGRYNKDNLSEVFGCDILTITLNRRVAKKLIRHGFEKLGSPTIAYDKAIYSYPLWMGIKFGIEWVMFGENTSYEYGGPLVKDEPSALNQINNDAVKTVPDSFWVEAGVSPKEMLPFTYPSEDAIKKANLNPQFLSYYLPWSGYENMQLAKAYGFLTLDDTGEWIREGVCEQYDQLDTKLYLVHPAIKHQKFGHARVTDVCSNWIREGRITREAAVQLVKEEDWKMDPEAVEDFCEFAGYTEKEFYTILDKWYNPELFEKDEKGKWELKNPIWEEGKIKNDTIC